VPHLGAFPWVISRSPAAPYIVLRKPSGDFPTEIDASFRSVMMPVELGDVAVPLISPGMPCK
jgi:hypothetical protein